jgi:hypothetical protein
MCTKMACAPDMLPKNKENQTKQDTVLGSGPPFVLLRRRLADALAGLRPPRLPHPTAPPSRPSRAPQAAPAVRGRVGDVPRGVPGGGRPRGVPVRALPALDPPPARRPGGWRGKEHPYGVPRGGGSRPPPVPGGPCRLCPRHPHPLRRYLPTLQRDLDASVSSAQISQ